jgi:hypothetical protein
MFYPSDGPKSIAILMYAFAESRATLRSRTDSVRAWAAHVLGCWLIVITLGGGCAPRLPVSTPSTNPGNIVFGAPAATPAPNKTIASIGKTPAGYRVEITDVPSGRIVWTSSGQGHDDVNPLISANGQVLVFERWMNQSTGIWIVALMNGAERQLTHLRDTLVDISPTGKYLIVARARPSINPGTVTEMVLLDPRSGEAEIEVYGAGARFLSDQEVLYCPKGTAAIYRQTIGSTTATRVCDGVLPTLDFDRRQFMCVRDVSLPPKERTWVVHKLDGELTCTLGPAFGPAFSTSGKEIIYVNAKLNGELWMWDISADLHKKIASPGYVSELRATPRGVMFFINEGTEGVISLMRAKHGKFGLLLA